MKSLVYTSTLGLLCMFAEILNLRKYAVALCVVGLTIILGFDIIGWLAHSGHCSDLIVMGINLTGWQVNQSYWFNMAIMDSYSAAFSGLLLLLAILVVLLSNNFYKNEKDKITDYLSIIIFTLCGAIAMVSFGNLVMFFLGLEVLSISLYVLAGSKRRDIRSHEAGMKYFLMGSFASGILLFGITLVYGEVGTFDIMEIAKYKGMVGSTGVWFNVGTGLILVALLFKVSAVPFHFWAPDVYDGSPTLITIVMATIAKIAAFAAFYRLFSTSFTAVMPLYAWVLSAVAALTITLGNFTALNQDSFKRMLAFSGISHAGYLMLGIISLGGKSDGAIFYYSFAYGLATVGAFAIAIVVANASGSDKIESFNGLGKRKPWLAGALTLTMLSLAGIPPFAGFFGKYYIFSEAIKTGHVYITILAVVNSVVGVYYYFKVIFAMYTKEPHQLVFSVKPAYVFVICFCLALILLTGIFPSTFAGLL